MKNISIFLIILMVFSCADKTKDDLRIANFPKQVEQVSKLPTKENFWIFILVGQSNMAGRGLVEPIDTVPSQRVYTLNKENNWVLAKEPLHYYEPSLTGLDCGLSFGKELSVLLNDSINIGLVPCAVGGSSVEQWLGDSLHREVKLFSNFQSKLEMASQAGTIKGILWHQGESNSHHEQFKDYKVNLRKLFLQFRMVAMNDSLPIIVGELGSFLNQADSHYADSVNQVLLEMTQWDKSIALVETDDLDHKGDTLHFNANSQRMLGIRFARKFKGMNKR